MPFTSRTNRFTALPEFPLVDYDISLLFDGAVSWEKIKAVLDKQIEKNHLLQGASFVDEYRGKQIPAGKKSVTIRLRIGSLEKTLTSQEIEKAASATQTALAKTLGSEIRTQ